LEKLTLEVHLEKLILEAHLGIVTVSIQKMEKLQVFVLIQETEKLLALD